MTIADEAEMAAFGRALARCLRPGDVIGLCGPLGAGKTSLARSMLFELGHLGEVPSPTFTLIQAYEPPDLRFPVLHADLYRIEDPDEIEELGLDEALTDGAIIIEWPERISVPFDNELRIAIEITGTTERRLTAKVPPPWEARWPPR